MAATWLHYPVTKPSTLAPIIAESAQRLVRRIEEFFSNGWHTIRLAHHAYRTRQQAAAQARFQALSPEMQRAHVAKAIGRYDEHLLNDVLGDR